MMARADFANTSPFFIHATTPGEFDPLRSQCRGQSCRQGREPCAHPHLCLSDESLERVTSAARIGGGMQDVSRPVPLEHDRSGQYIGHLWANRVMLALAICWVGYYVGKVFG